MKNIFIIFSLAFALIGCFDKGEASSGEGQKEYSLNGHPLANYSEAEDYKIVRLFPHFHYQCKEGVSKAQCDAFVNQAVETAKKYGLKATREDFLNPLYWDLQTSVIEKYSQKKDYFSNLTKNIASPKERIQKGAERKEFRAEAQRRLDMFKQGKFK